MKEYSDDGYKKTEVELVPVKPYTMKKSKGKFIPNDKSLITHHCKRIKVEEVWNEPSREEYLAVKALAEKSPPSILEKPHEPDEVREKLESNKRIFSDFLEARNLPHDVNDVHLVIKKNGKVLDTIETNTRSNQYPDDLKKATERARELGIDVDERGCAIHPTSTTDVKEIYDYEDKNGVERRFFKISLLQKERAEFAGVENAVSGLSHTEQALFALDNGNREHGLFEALKASSHMSFLFIADMEPAYHAHLKRVEGGKDNLDPQRKKEQAERDRLLDEIVQEIIKENPNKPHEWIYKRSSYVLSERKLGFTLGESAIKKRYQTDMKTLKAKIVGD